MFDSRPVDSAAWDSYVDTQPQALFTHRHGYVQVLADTYRLPAVFLQSMTASGQLVGALPLMLFAAPDRARRLISLPYSDGAGLLADDEDAAGDLLHQALSEAERFDCLHLEVRQAGDAPHIPRENLSGWQHLAHTFKTGLARDLPNSSCTLWGELPDKVRNQGRIVIDLHRARVVPGFTGRFSLKITGPGLVNLGLPGEQPDEDPRESECRVLELSSDQEVVSIGGEKGLLSASARLLGESFVLPPKVL